MKAVRMLVASEMRPMIAGRIATAENRHDLERRASFGQRA